MSQRHFTYIFIALTVMVIMILGYSKLLQDKTVSELQTNMPIASYSAEVNSGSLSGGATGASQIGTKPVKQYPKFPGELIPAELKGKKAVIETNQGKIEFEIYPEATKAASNFIFLARDHFYDGLTFHRVVPNFVIQGGDPLGNGMGGPGYKFDDEPVTRPYKKGTVAMANAGPNTNGSQFFIVLADNVGLEPKYTIFGNVISGINIVDKIAVGDVMKAITIENLR